ncbi:uncharacterized protein LOC142178327 [Nicotiana tabacum]|uniref:Uncharacterized protein LOC142178327 n=1 Tax=Nicotiana tabacum TaxID=4097 RepID=A0AC58U310_TOBAC
MIPGVVNNPHPEGRKCGSRYVSKSGPIKIFRDQKRLETAKGRWPEELPGVLWAYRTTVKSSIEETLFSLVCGVEALIPVEVGEPTLRYSQTNEESNSKVMLINLEMLEGCRDLTHVRMTAQKQRMERYYNQRTNLRLFKVGDLVLRKVTQNTRELNAGKLASTWEGPYRVSAITGKGSYELENQNGDKLPSQPGKKIREDNTKCHVNWERKSGKATLNATSIGNENLGRQH